MKCSKLHIYPGTQKAINPFYGGGGGGGGVGGGVGVGWGGGLGGWGINWLAILSHFQHGVLQLCMHGLQIPVSSPCDYHD